MTLFRALRIRSFALLWAGQTVSRLGDGLFTVALSWWVLEQTGSAAAMGLVQIFRFVPNLLFLLIGGVLADRLPRLRVMLVSDLLRGVLLTIVAILTAAHALQIWHIYIVSLLFGFVGAFFQPAYVAVIPDVVSGDDLISANSLNALSTEFSGIFGMTLGGVIVAVTGSSVAFGLDSVSFFIAAVCVLPILGRIAPPVRDTSVPAPNAIQELREGLAAVWNIRWLRITIPLASVSNMFLFSITEISTPFFVKDSLHADSVAFGLMVASISVGAIIGAAGMGSVRKLRRRGLLAYGCWISSCLLIGSIGLSQTVVMACLISVGAGMASAAGQLIWANVLQELVPANLLGRVSSVEQLGSTGLVPLGLGLVGWATGQFGAAAVFILGGLLAAGAFSFGLFSNAVRGLK